MAGINSEVMWSIHVEETDKQFNDNNRGKALDHIYKYMRKATDNEMDINVSYVEKVVCKRGITILKRKLHPEHSISDVSICIEEIIDGIDGIEINATITESTPRYNNFGTYNMPIILKDGFWQIGKVDIIDKMDNDYKILFNSILPNIIKFLNDAFGLTSPMIKSAAKS